MSRNERARIAAETVKILERGTYSSVDGRTVRIADRLASACAGTRLYRPDAYDSVIAAALALPGHCTADVRVVNGTTLAAARALVAEGTGRVACLNFASAKNPGGGFLGGSQAQEESLARATGLYPTLLRQPAFYEYHRRHASLLYSDHMIYSPDVPVFRDDDDRLLDEPWSVSILTAAAVNAGALRGNEPESLPRVPAAMERRARMLLAVLALQGCDVVVLGAWGCGVFRNDPANVAAMFRSVLEAPPIAGRFRRVVFAIHDTQPGAPVLQAFERAFE